MWFSLLSDSQWSVWVEGRGAAQQGVMGLWETLLKQTKWKISVCKETEYLEFRVKTGTANWPRVRRLLLYVCVCVFVGGWGGGGGGGSKRGSEVWPQLDLYPYCPPAALVHTQLTLSAFMMRWRALPLLWYTSANGFFSIATAADAHGALKRHTVIEL